MKGFIEITSGGETSLIAIACIAHIRRPWPEELSEYEPFCRPGTVGAIVHTHGVRGPGAIIATNETYEQLRDALEAAT